MDHKEVVVGSNLVLQSLDQLVVARYSIPLSLHSPPLQSLLLWLDSSFPRYYLVVDCCDSPSFKVYPSHQEFRHPDPCPPIPDFCSLIPDCCSFVPDFHSFNMAQSLTFTSRLIDPAFDPAYVYMTILIVLVFLIVIVTLIAVVLIIISGMREEILE